MKKTFLLLAALLCAATALAAPSFTLSGSVKDANGAPVPMANVVLLHADSMQVAAATSSDAEGGLFSLRAPKGEYKLVVQFIGYEKFSADVHLASDTAMPVVLKTESVGIEAVAVTTQFVTRQGDRFVMNVAGSAQAIGRTADEMLKLAPGVWITDEKLSINGREGTRIMVNERLLNMPFTDALLYLKSIKAEDILKVEVIPDAGADYDANSSGGIIKITLKRQRQDGIQGSVSMSGQVSGAENTYSYNPAFNINYRRRALSLYTNLNYYGSGSSQKIRENTLYDGNAGSIASSTLIESDNNIPSFRLGGIYDLTDNQSVGLEMGYNNVKDRDVTSGKSIFTTPATTTNNLSDYSNDPLRHSLNATANWIWRTDTLGSVLKVIGDVYVRRGFSDGYFANSSSVAPAPMAIDSVYSNSLSADYRIWSLSAAWEKIFSPLFTLKAGGKFSYNDMWDGTNYEAYRLSTGTWYPLDTYSGENKYIERISALYAIADTKFFKKLSVSAGLRAEYTYATPEAAMGISGGSPAEELAAAKQDYLSLFPNLNVSLPLNQKQSTQLIFAYSRKIDRPGFWALNPFMVPMSRYSYVVGNPRLKPTFNNSLTLTGVYKYKYTLTAGVSLVKNSISQIGFLDPNDPEIFVYQHRNIPNSETYFVSLNLPLKLTKWWDLNFNATGMNLSNDYDGVTRRSNMLHSSVNTTFTLPAAFMLEFSGWANLGKAYSGNMEIGNQGSMDASVKKRFLKNRLTASFTAGNLINSGEMDIRLTGDGFVKHTYVQNEYNAWRTYSLSLRYNFNSGISFKAKKVESGSTEESSRIGK